VTTTSAAAVSRDAWKNRTETFEIGIVMGKSGTGKTSLVESLVVPAARAGHRVWVVDPNDAWDGAENDGIRTVKSPPDGDWESVLNALAALRDKPGTVVFDDADLYLRFCPSFARVWMTSHRHLRKNLVLIARRPAGMADILGNADWFALFAMREENAREKWRATLGDDVADMIPREPYRYAYLKDPDPPKLLATPKRPRLHRSEIMS
jgi:hypothetical protein